MSVSRARSAHFRTLTREGIGEAIRLLERAVEIDPDFALPMRLGKQVEDGMAVAIDGVIYQDAYAAPLAEGAEIYLIPKIAGG